jgi:hypothetical protein
MTAILRKCFLDRNVSPLPFVVSQVGEMDLEIQLPNTAVVMSGDVAENLYLVVSGSLTRESPQGESAPPDDAAVRRGLSRNLGNRCSAFFERQPLHFDV